VSFWADLEKVLHDAVVAGSGIPGAKVIWWAQNFPRPARPYAVVKRGTVTPIGSTVERRKVYNSTAPAGSEIELHAREQVEFTLGVQIFTADARGDACAVALAEAVRAHLTARGQLDAFQVAGLALVNRGIVQNVSALLQTDYEGRASLDVTFRVATETVESTTFIQTADVEQILQE
jgi:hypothetical protein